MLSVGSSSTTSKDHLNLGVIGLNGTVYQINYLLFERVGIREFDEKDKRVSFCTFNKFTFPYGMTELEGFFVLSYLFDKVACDNGFEKNALETVSMVDDRMSQYGFNVNFVKSNRFAEVKPLYVLDGHVEDADDLSLSIEGRNWYKADIKRDVVQNIYSHLGKNLDEIEHVVSIASHTKKVPS